MQFHFRRQRSRIVISIRGRITIFSKVVDSITKDREILNGAINRITNREVLVQIIIKIEMAIIITIDFVLIRHREIKIRINDHREIRMVTFFASTVEDGTILRENVSNDNESNNHNKVTTLRAAIKDKVTRETSKATCNTKRQ